MAEPVEPPAGPSLWDLHKQWEGIPPDTELPASLDAKRAQHQDDGLAHCPTCGGEWFTATVKFRTDGAPHQVLTPQSCLGCGTQRRANWQG